MTDPTGASGAGGEGDPTLRHHGPAFETGDQPGSMEIAFERFLAGLRWLILVPVVVLAVAAVGAFAYGVEVLVNSVGEVVRHPNPVGNKIGLFLLIVDLLLIGATLLIAAIGLYELFISRVDSPGASRLPDWLQMHDLNDLKARVIAMIVLVAAVSFVEVVVDAEPALHVLELGGGIAAVIVALTLFLKLSGQGHSRD